jgi:hypothetical protein
MEVYEAADKSAEDACPVDLLPPALPSGRTEPRPSDSIKNAAADRR